MRPADRGVKFSGYLANENAELFQVPDPRPVRSPARPSPASWTRAHRTSAAPTPSPTSSTSPPTPSTWPPQPTQPTRPTRPGQPWTVPTASRCSRRAAGSAAASGAAAVAGHGPKAHITITIDLKDLTDAGAHAVGTLVHGEGLSAGAIRRLACEARIIPIVLGANSEPLDVAMAQRFVNRAMRRALNARDKGCVVCKAPPIFCDAHHLISWIDHGPTALTNLVLLCRRHHIDTHHGHWTITLHRGTVTVARPPGPNPAPPTPNPLPHPHHQLPRHAAEQSDSPARNHAQPRPPPPRTTAATSRGRAVRPLGRHRPARTRLRQTHPSTRRPAPGHRALHHADNPPPAATADDRDRDWRPPVTRSTEPRTGPPCARPN